MPRLVPLWELIVAMATMTPAAVESTLGSDARGVSVEPANALIP